MTTRTRLATAALRCAVLVSGFVPFALWLATSGSGLEAPVPAASQVVATERPAAAQPSGCVAGRPSDEDRDDRIDPECAEVALEPRTHKPRPSRSAEPTSSPEEADPTQPAVAQASAAAQPNNGGSGGGGSAATPAPPPAAAPPQPTPRPPAPGPTPAPPPPRSTPPPTRTPTPKPTPTPTRTAAPTPTPTICVELLGVCI